MVFTLGPSAHLGSLATGHGLGKIPISSHTACFVYGGDECSSRCVLKAPQMLDELNSLKLWDFWIESFGTSKDGDDLLVINAGQDFPNSHATLCFEETEYISCPIRFHHAQFREATATEANAVKNQTEYESKLFAVDTDVGDSQAERTFFIAAKTVDVVIGVTN